MKKIIVALAALLALMLGAAAPAMAQGQSVTADPPSVAEAGEHTFTISGSGYSLDVFVLPCPGAGGDPTAIAEDSCDLTALTPASPDADGNWSVEVTFNIPAEGLVVVAGDATQTEVGATVIAVGGLADTGADSTTSAVLVVVALIAGVAMLTGGRRLARD